MMRRARATRVFYASRPTSPTHLLYTRYLHCWIQLFDSISAASALGCLHPFGQDLDPSCLVLEEHQFRPRRLLMPSKRTDGRSMTQRWSVRRKRIDTRVVRRRLWGHLLFSLDYSTVGAPVSASHAVRMSYRPAQNDKWEAAILCAL
jgi:hypothetical protein